jgi:SAM-dependent methyltransferase
MHTRLGTRLLRRIGRSLTPDTRARQRRSEVDYWRLWFETRGLEWPQDYSDRFDPSAPIQEWIAPYIDRIGKDEVEILDVGAGPLTKLGKVHPTKRLAITPIDQLADAYNAIVDRFGLRPPIRTRCCDAEKLTEAFDGQTFDIVHAENSMDHAVDAIAALREMLAMARPGGFVLLRHAEHEGLNNAYSGLHQWDFLHDNGRFVVGGPGPRGPRQDISRAFAEMADVECWSDGECVYVAMAKKA